MAKQNDVTLNGPSGQPRTVASLDLPTGKYFLGAQAYAGSVIAVAVVCRLTGNGVTGVQTAATPHGGIWGPIAIFGVAEFGAGGGQVFMTCHKEGDASAQPYLRAQTIWAVKTNSVTITTQA